jgi:3-hydroxyisobutyrate dehydrogenase-like beta-hydroxyacid dehydrogenase
MTVATVALIGFGEVGRALAADLKDVAVRVFDIRRPPESLGSAAEAARGADLVICAVTAAQTVAAAQSVVAGLKPGAWFMDLNSASPAARIGAAAAVESAAGRYVEVAVMAPIAPDRLAAPMLLGGPHAKAFAPLAQALGFTGARFYSAEPGKAAATKLCRSVMIKGLEALISESLLAARHYGVEDVVLNSLNNLFPHPDWPAYARYMIARTLEHGTRRAEEMAEAARTVAEAGVAPWMSEAAAKRQAWAPAFAEALKNDDLHSLLDAMRAGRSQEEQA